MQNNIAETLTMTSNEIQIEIQTDYQIGLTRPYQQCNLTRSRTTDKEERKKTRFAFLKISAITHYTHLQSRASQLTTQALQKSAILPTHLINIEEE